MIVAERLDFGFLLSEARGYRSRESMYFPLQTVLLPPGTPVGAFGGIAITGDSIVAVTLTAVDARRQGVVAPVLARSAEVVDYGLSIYDHPLLDVQDLHRGLARLGIAVRAGPFEPVRWLPADARLEFPDPDDPATAQLVPVEGAPPSGEFHRWGLRLFGVVLAFQWRRRAPR